MYKYKLLPEESIKRSGRKIASKNIYFGAKIFYSALGDVFIVHGQRH